MNTPLDTPTLRILDASINRASEGLRTVEDYARFALDNASIAHSAKGLRHHLTTVTAVLPHDALAAARETLRDVGRDETKLTEPYRRDKYVVAVAGVKRAQQALRTIEEYGKLFDRKFAAQVERLRYCSYTLEKELAATVINNERLASARLCVLIEGGDDEEEFEDLVWRLTEAGVPMLQLRDKKLSERLLVERGRVLVELTRGKCIAIINDRPDIAAATHADGVHLGQEDMSVKDARSIVGARALIGVSTHKIEDARRAVLDGANYLGAGPTFPSKTKSFDDFPGLDYLREVSAEVTLPTFAIGGIDVENLPDVLQTGATRIAVAGAIDFSSSISAADGSRRVLKALSDASTPVDG